MSDTVWLLVRIVVGALVVAFVGFVMWEVHTTGMARIALNEKLAVECVESGKSAYDCKNDAHLRTYRGRR